MTDRLSDLSSRDFAAALASKQPVPGGGGVAALVGSLAAALCSMVGNFTVGKKRYVEVESDIERMLGEAEDLREQLLDLIEADAKAFEPLSRAYAIPKSDPSRTATLEEASKVASQAPLNIMDACARTIDVLAEMGDKGSRMLLSDVACGSFFAVAALQSASINVFENTQAYRSSSWAQEYEAHAKKLLSEYVDRGSKVALGILDQLKG